ncbi:MAG: hypothetical protein R3F61_00040 [Myxococcota bacterium]
MSRRPEPRAATPASGLQELGFLGFWLFFWTFGVCLIQSSVVANGMGSGLLLFMVTHGGAEVGVLIALARRISASASALSAPPRIRRDHAGIQASWSVGSGTMSGFVTSAVYGLFVHALLIGTVLAVLPTATASGTLLGALLLGVWACTGALWANAALEHLRSRRTVALDADVDRVRIEVGSQEIVLPLAGLSVDEHEGRIALRSGEQTWECACAPGPERSELLDALRVMSERAVPAQAVPEPDALRRMRGQGTSVSDQS